MNTLRPPTASDIGLLVSVSALWGSAFLCNALALETFAPVAIAGWRISLACIVILITCRLQGLTLPRDARSWWLLTGIGWLNSAIPFSLIGWGQQSVDAATTGILLAASPFATLLLSHFLSADDRFSAGKLVGLLMGFVGVMLLIGREVSLDPGQAGGMLAIVAAACCYSLSAILIRHLSGLGSLQVVAGSSLCSAALLVPILLLRYPPWEQAVSTRSLAALAFLALGPTAVAYVLRTRIVQNNGAVFMSNAGYLIPLFAVLWAWLFLGITPGWHAWIAMLFIFAGIEIGRRWR